MIGNNKNKMYTNKNLIQIQVYFVTKHHFHIKKLNTYLFLQKYLISNIFTYFTKKHV